VSGPGSNLWYLATPPPTVPVPAATVPELKGRRIIVGAVGGFRHDMIAGSEAHVRPDGRVYVGVLSEYDQHRSHLTDVDVPLHPTQIDQVWVEHRLAPRHPPAGDGDTAGYDWDLLNAEEEGASQPERPVGEQVDELLTRLVSLEAPPGRTPRRAADPQPLTGSRLILVNPDEFLYNNRAVSEPYCRPDGIICANVTSSSDWYAWAITGERPEITNWPIERVWLD